MKTERPPSGGMAAPDSVDLVDAAAGQLAAYVHIPFCRRVCPYCDFAVVAGTGLADRYLAAIVSEIERSEPFDRPLAAVAFGGGTPSSLPPAFLGRILGAIRDRFGLEAGAEVSIEVNPEDVTEPIAAELRAVGFTRMSLGVQSFDDSVLRSLGRSHSAEQASAAISKALAAFERVSVDLIYGTPGETPASWQESVRRALDTGVGHLSTYALTVERGTPLSRAVASGAPAPDPDTQADAFEAACAMAAAAGLVRYETSNHARPGETVLYNLVTWAQGEYAAFGNGAHRHRDGIRSWNVARVDRYVERIEAGASPVSNSEHLDDWGREIERVMLGLRRAAGVMPGQAGERLLASGWGEQLLEAGILQLRDGRLVVADAMRGDEVSRALLGLEAP